MAGWILKNWCFRKVVLEKTLDSPLDSKIKPVNLEGNQPWLFIGRTDDEAEAAIFWPPDVKSQLLGKDSDAEKDWGRRRGGDRGWDGWMASLTQQTSPYKLREMKDRGAWHAAVHGAAKSQTRLNDWTTTIIGSTTKRLNKLLSVPLTISVMSSSIASKWWLIKLTPM